MRRRAGAAESISMPEQPRREHVVLSDDMRTRIRFVQVPNSPVLKLERDDGRDVAGAFVRYAPRLRRSEREAFDVRAVEAALRARGARVVVASPVLLPDEAEAKRSEASTLDARDEVRAWFANDDTNDGRAALERCLRILDEVGF